jgi:hypothetical protein
MAIGRPGDLLALQHTLGDQLYSILSFTPLLLAAAGCYFRGK